MLDTLLEMFKQPFSTCEGETFEEKVRIYSSKDVALSTDGENVFIFFGPPTAQFTILSEFWFIAAIEVHTTGSKHV